MTQLTCEDAVSSDRTTKNGLVEHHRDLRRVDHPGEHHPAFDAELDSTLNLRWVFACVAHLNDHAGIPFGLKQARNQPDFVHVELLRRFFQSDVEIESFGNHVPEGVPPAPSFRFLRQSHKGFGQVA
ncbi:hypothetical protein AOB60_37720 [Streptomyces noursei]|uniref:Uncharacterized protein n=1 Tax=Streptomyces noursei TaxID=1971 RepID=A0A2N8P4F7_STRNR|nr:hypothetical protein AOB60_37720 [Streptomyces noursei]